DGIRDRNVTGVQTCALPIFFDLQTIKLNAQPGWRDAMVCQDAVYGSEEVLLFPVGVHNIVAVGGAPWHATVNPRGNGCRSLRGNDHSKCATEWRWHEIRKVFDVVHAREHESIKIVSR